MAWTKQSLWCARELARSRSRGFTTFDAFGFELPQLANLFVTAISKYLHNINYKRNACHAQIAMSAFPAFGASCVENSNGVPVLAGRIKGGCLPTLPCSAALARCQSSFSGRLFFDNAQAARPRQSDRRVDVCPSVPTEHRRQTTCERNPENTKTIVDNS